MIAIAGLVWQTLKAKMWARVLAATLAALAALHANNLYQRHVGAASLVAKSQKEAKAINAKAQDAHRRADRPDAADRLRKDYCRDC